MWSQNAGVNTSYYSNSYSYPRELLLVVNFGRICKVTPENKNITNKKCNMRKRIKKRGGGESNCTVFDIVVRNVIVVSCNSSFDRLRASFQVWWAHHISKRLTDCTQSKHTVSGYLTLLFCCLAPLFTLSGARPSPFEKWRARNTWKVT